MLHMLRNYSQILHHDVEKTTIVFILHILKSYLKTHVLSSYPTCVFCPTLSKQQKSRHATINHFKKKRLFYTMCNCYHLFSLQQCRYKHICTINSTDRYVNICTSTAQILENIFSPQKSTYFHYQQYRYVNICTSTAQILLNIFSPTVFAFQQHRYSLILFSD